MKVIQAQGSKSKTVSSIDLELKDSGLPSEIQNQIKDEVGTFLVEQILLRVGNSKSPVSGEPWPALKKGPYKKQKIALGLPGVANMESSGEMLDALEFKKTPQGIEVGVFGPKAWQADGHVKFESNEGLAPRRRFLPGKGQEFISEIQGRAEQLVADMVADAVPISKSDLKDVETKSELYDVLESIYSGLSRLEIKNAVLRSDAIIKILNELDILDLL